MALAPCRHCRRSEVAEGAPVCPSCGGPRPHPSDEQAMRTQNRWALGGLVIGPVLGAIALPFLVPAFNPRFRIQEQGWLAALWGAFIGLIVGGLFGVIIGFVMSSRRQA